MPLKIAAVVILIVAEMEPVIAGAVMYCDGLARGRRHTAFCSGRVEFSVRFSAHASWNSYENIRRHWKKTLSLRAYTPTHIYTPTHMHSPTLISSLLPTPTCTHTLLYFGATDTQNQAELYCFVFLLLLRLCCHANTKPNSTTLFTYRENMFPRSCWC